MKSVKIRTLICAPFVPYPFFISMQIFMICGYHNYAASGYVIRYEQVVVRYLGTYRGTDCQKSATDVKLKLLTVIPDAHCSSYESLAHRRAWSAVEINATSTHSTYFDVSFSYATVLAMESPAAASSVCDPRSVGCVWPKNIWFLLYG